MATPKKQAPKGKQQGGEKPNAPVAGRISVPEDMGSSLRLLPNGPAHAVLEKLILGTSKTSKQPKLTLQYVIDQDMDDIPDGEPTTIGEKVLETCSLQPQALWKLNDIYKAATGERIPHGDFDTSEFVGMVTEALAGTEWNLMLEQKVPSDGSSSELRTEVVGKTLSK